MSLQFSGSARQRPCGVAQLHQRRDERNALQPPHLHELLASRSRPSESQRRPYPLVDVIASVRAVPLENRLHRIQRRLCLALGALAAGESDAHRAEQLRCALFRQAALQLPDAKDQGNFSGVYGSGHTDVATKRLRRMIGVVAPAFSPSGQPLTCSIRAPRSVAPRSSRPKPIKRLGSQDS